jgi:3-oxoacyl-[acyl-carrier protein] reductase
VSVLANQIALVTGGARGIGRAIALELAGLGADVALFDLSVAGLEETAGLVKARGRQALCLSGDVTKGDDARMAVERTIADLGGLHIVVNNAGVTRDGLLMRMKEEDWDLVLDVNLKGTFNFSQAAVRHFLKQRAGRIISIASVVGVTGNAGQANYAASKGGIISFTYSLAKELGARGVTANAVAPGFIETDMTAALSPEVRKALGDRIPAGRLGRPEDVAAAVAFLAGPSASYINGVVIRVDGGLSIA